VYKILGREFGTLSTVEPTETVERSMTSKASDGSILMDLNDIAQKYGPNDDTLAARIEAVYSCWRDKSETVGQIPLKMYSGVGDDRKLVESGRDHRIFTQKPNDFQNINQFIENIIISLERVGAFYAYVERNDNDSVMSIVPFKDQTSIVPNMDINGNVYYTHVKNNGRLGDAYDLENLFVVKGFTVDGFTPISPLRQTETNLQIARSQDENYKETQTQGITSQMGLKTEQTFQDTTARDRLKDDFRKARGPNGVREIPIFEQGLTPVSLKLTPQEVELLKQREFTVNRICRTFRVPLHRVGVQNTLSKDNVYVLDEAYMRDSLNPAMVKIEREMSRLMRTGFNVVFDRNAFYEGSPWRLIEHVEKAVKGGLLTINEARKILGWPRIDGGDVFAIDNNNVVYGFWKDLEAMQALIYGDNKSE